MNTIALKSILSESKDGEWGQAEPGIYTQEMAVIRGTDFDSVRVGVLDQVPNRHVKCRIAERKKLKPYDIIIETAGGSKDRPTGRTLFLSPSVFRKMSLPVTCASFSRYLRIDPAKANPHYIYWVLQYLYMTRQMSKYHTQHTGVARFQFTTFAEIEPLPICATTAQAKIAAILSAYDDLIENNTRRIKILEEMAQTIYREWFVNFRFPGHEKVKMVDSPLGKIPEGWERTYFTDIANVIGGGTPSTRNEEFWNGSIPFYTPKDYPSFFYVFKTEKYITEKGLEKCSSRLFSIETIFITARGSVGNVTLPGINMAMNQSCYALESKNNLDFRWVFLLTRNLIDILKKKTHGAVFDTVIMDTFRSLEVIKPAETIVSSFSRIIGPIFSRIHNLLRSNENLRQTRDLLLPKLISGELDVSELDIKVSAIGNG